MADPTATAVACTASAGATIYTLSCLGIDHVALTWAFVGAVFGLGMPRESTRWRAVASFTGSIFLGSLAGGIAAALVKPEWQFWALRAGAAVAGFGLHWAGEAFIKQLEPLARGFADRLGAKRP